MESAWPAMIRATFLPPNSRSEAVVHDALRRMGVKVSEPTIENILAEHGLGPRPRTPKVRESLRTSVKDALWALDFFAVRLAKGKSVQVLLIIDIARATGSSVSPTLSWRRWSRQVVARSNSARVRHRGRCEPTPKSPRENRAVSHRSRRRPTLLSSAPPGAEIRAPRRHLPHWMARAFVVCLTVARPV